MFIKFFLNTIKVGQHFFLTCQVKLIKKNNKLKVTFFFFSNLIKLKINLQQKLTQLVL